MLELRLRAGRHASPSAERYRMPGSSLKGRCPRTQYWPPAPHSPLTNTWSGSPVALVGCQAKPFGERQSRLVGEPSPPSRADTARSPDGPAATLARLAPSSPGKPSGRAAQSNEIGAGADGLGLGCEAMGAVAVG